VVLGVQRSPGRLRTVTTSAFFQPVIPKSRAFTSGARDLARIATALKLRVTLWRFSRKPLAALGSACGPVIVPVFKATLHKGLRVVSEV
jgi:hypothetical protein